jgi:hypothetical protein
MSLECRLEEARNKLVEAEATTTNTLNKSYYTEVRILEHMLMCRDKYPSLSVDFQRRRGFIRVNNIFEFVVNTRRWRRLGKSKWYWSKGFEHFARIALDIEPEGS